MFWEDGRVAYIYQCKFGDDCDFVSLGGGDEEREDKAEYGINVAQD